MTENGFLRRLKSRRVALVAAGAGAAVIVAATVAVPTGTVASFVDEVWAGEGFSAGTFSGIESSQSRTGTYVKTSESGPLQLTTPISLVPGETAYAAVYLQRTDREPTDPHAVVSISGPTGADESWDSLWNTHITFRAKAAPATGTTSCDRSSSEYWTELYESSKLATPQRSVDAEGNDTTFTLGQLFEGSSFYTGDPYIVCFGFTLSENADSGSNGKSVYPVWTFTAESQEQS